MTRFALPFTDAELYLTPRWGVGGVLVSRRAAFVLLALRVLVVLVLLCIVFVPTVARSSQETQAQSILVFVDRTASMEVSDPQRPAVEKLKLARALHLARDLASDLQLDEWIQQYQRPDGPEWAAADEFKDDAERRKQLIAERRRLHDQVCRRVDGLSRTEICRRLLAEDGGGLRKRLEGVHQVEMYGFARDVW